MPSLSIGSFILDLSVLQPVIEYTSADLLILDGMNAFVPVFLESFRPIVKVGKGQIKGVTK